MPTDKSFKVNIYRVELEEIENVIQVSFDQAVQNAWGQQFVDRFKEIGGRGHRLDHFRQQGDCFLMNFASFAFYGPGRVTPQTQIAPMGLAANEHYGHETSLVYDHPSETVFVEANINGLGSGAIAHYFRQFANSHSRYTLVPVLDEDASARARRHQTIRSVTVRMATGPITEADHRAGTSAYKALGGGFEGASIDVEIKARRSPRDSLNIGGVWDSLTQWLDNPRDKGITGLRVKGREHDDEPYEIIDLLQQYQKGEILLEVNDDTRNIPLASRWDALMQVRNRFNQ